MASPIDNIAQKLKELSDRTTDRGSRQLTAFDPKQQVEALASEFRTLKPETFAPVGSMLFSSSVSYNALDYCDLALKSAEFSKDLIDTRARLYEALAEFIDLAGATGVQDHVVELRNHTVLWLRNENSAKSKLACLLPLQSAFRCQEIAFGEKCDIPALAVLLKDRFLYGKAAQEFYSNGVKGSLLSMLGLMCARFPALGNQRDPNEPQSSKETMGASVKRLCLYSLEEQLKGESREPSTTLQSGALVGLRFALEGCPCDEPEADRIFKILQPYMVVSDDLRRYEVPVQAIAILKNHAGLLARQIMVSPLNLFNKLRDLCTKSDRIRPVAFGASIELVRVVAKCVQRNVECETEEELEAKRSADLALAEDDSDEINLNVGDILSTSNKPIARVELEKDARQKVLNMFMKTFYEIMRTALEGTGEADATTRRATRMNADLAIEGYGMFAGAVVELFDESRLFDVLHKLFDLSDKMRSSASEQEQSLGNEWERRSKVNEGLARRVRFLSAYARISQHLSSGSLNENTVIKRLGSEVVTLANELRTFPRYLVMSFTLTTARLFQSLARIGSTLQTLVGMVMFPLVRQSVSPNSILDEGETLVYEDFWKHLLPSNDDVRTAGSSASASQDDVARTEAHRMVFDHLISVSIKIVSRLNLDCTVGNALDRLLPDDSSVIQEESAGDEITSRESTGVSRESSSNALLHSTARVMPSSIDDVILLHNLTLLLDRVLPRCNPSHLVDWLPLFTQMISAGLERNPLVSDWYRLMSLAFCALDKLAQTGPFTIDAQVQHSIDGFIQTTALRTKQYQSELLAASLSCILKTPRGAILERHLRQLVPCLIAALQMGLSYPPAAKNALNELERWIHVTPRHLLERYYPAILPELAAYLSSAANRSRGGAVLVAEELDDEGVQIKGDNSLFGQIEGFTAEEDETLKRQYAVSHGRTRKAALKSLHRSIKQSKPDESDLALGLKAVRILGLVGGNSRFVLPSMTELLNKAQKWDPIQCLAVEFQLGEFKFDDVYLDAILPIVTSLARTCNHRQTKVAACETLHALVLIMVGSAANDAGGDKDSRFANIYPRLFPEILRLAVDVEPVAKQLFQPLVGQLARWFSRTNPSGGDRAETVALLDAVVESLSDEADGALRDLAAETLAIFFRWVLKSTNARASAGEAKRQKTTTTTLHVHAMLQRLYALMRHPDPFKRLGSSLAFGAFYKDFREDNALVDEHALQLLENSIVMLRMAEADPAALGTKEAAGEVFSRVSRIVATKAVELQRPNPSRLAFPTLGDSLKWLMTFCMSNEHSVRAKCQDLFETLVPAADPSKSKQASLKAWFEKNQIEPPELDGNLAELNKEVLDEVFSRIDYYMWMSRLGRVSAEDTNHVESLVERLLESVDRLFNDDVNDATVNDGFNLSLERCLRRVLDLVSSHITNFGEVADQCLKVGLLFLIIPQAVGVDSEARDFKLFFPGALTRLVEATGRKVDAVLHGLVKQKRLGFGNIVLAQAQSLSVLRGLVHLTRCRVDIHKADPSFSATDLAKQVQLIKQGSTPQTLRNGAAALILCQETGMAATDIIALAFDSTKQGSSTLGAQFLEHYQEDIVRAFLKRPHTCCSLLLGTMNLKAETRTDTSASAFRLLVAMLDAAIKAGPTEARLAILNDINLADLAMHASNPDVRQLLSRIIQVIALVPLEERERHLGSAFDALAQAVRVAASNISARLDLLQQCLPPLLSGPVPRMADAPPSVATGFFVVQSNDKMFPRPLSEHERRILDFIEREIVSAFFPPNLARLSVATSDTERIGLERYLAALEALLGILASTGSVLVLRVLFRVTSKADIDIHRQTLLDGFKRLVENVDCSVHESQNELPCFELFAECMRALNKESTEIAKASRLFLFQNLFVPLGRKLTSRGWEYLLTSKDKIGPGISVLTALLEVIENPLESDVAKKHCVFAAFGCFYESASPETIQSVQRIAFGGGEGTGGQGGATKSSKLTQDLSKHAERALSSNAKMVLESKRETISTRGANLWGGGHPGAAARGEDLVRALEPSQKYCNAVYACLVAVVCRTQSKPMIFDKLLFGEDVANWWHVLIPMRNDASSEPAFSEVSVDALTNPPRSRIVMRSILDGNQLAQQSTNRLATETSMSWSMSSQTFSSLAVDDDAMDAIAPGRSSVRPPVPAFSATAAGVQPAAIASLQGTPSEREIQCAVDEQAELELDAVNSLPAMSALLTLLDTCRRKSIITVGAQEGDAVPKWVLAVLNAITDTRASGGDVRQSINIRIFGCKIVLNRPSLFEPYARKLIAPIMQLCLDLETPFVQDIDRRRGLNTFLAEVLRLLLLWDTRDKSLQRAFGEDDLNGWRLASRFIALVFRLAPSPTQITMRSNVKLVVAILDALKNERLEIQGEPLLQMCHHPEGSRLSAASAQSCGILLLSALAGFEDQIAFPPNDVLPRDLFDVLIQQNLRSKTKSVRTLAAHLLGLLFRDRRHVDDLKVVKDYLVELDRRNEFERWLEVVSYMVNERLEGLLSRDSINRLLGMMSRMEGEFLKMAMKILLYTVKRNESDVPPSDIYRTLIPLLKDPRLLAETNPHVPSLIGTIDVIDELIRVGGPSQSWLPLSCFSQDGWFNSVVVLSSVHPSSNVRNRCLGLLDRISTEHPVILANSRAAHTTMSESRSTKKKGDTDDREVQRSDEAHKVVESIRCALLASLSDPNPLIQKQKLDLWDKSKVSGDSPVTRLVSALTELGPTSTWFYSSDSGARVMKRIQSSWTSSLAQLMLMLSRSSAEYNDPKRSLLFAKPLDGAVSAGTQMDVDTRDSSSALSSMQPLFMSQLGTQHILASQAEEGGMLVRATQQMMLNFAPTQQLMEAPWSSRSGAQFTGGASWSTQQMSSQIMGPPQSHSTSSRRAGRNHPSGRRVVVLRKYRKGELPDVQIPRRDFFEPLIVLCGLDSSVAHGVVDSLARSILRRAADSKDKSGFLKGIDVNGLPSTLIHSLEALLRCAARTRGEAEASFVATLVQLSVAVGEQSDRRVSPKLLSEACLSAGTLARGVIAVEDWLLGRAIAVSRNPDASTSKKRARIGNTEDHAHQLEEEREEDALEALASLYTRMKDADASLGLSARLSRLEESHRALQLATIGEHQKALKLFHEVLMKDEVSARERFAAWQGRVHSQSSLRRWSEAFKEMVHCVRERTGDPRGADVPADAEDMRASDRELFAVDTLETGRERRIAADKVAPLVAAGLRAPQYARLAVHLVDLACHDDAKAVALEAEAPLEMILTELSRAEGPDWGQAQKHADGAVQRFLHNFGAQSPLAAASRRALLEPLHVLTEMQDALRARQSCAAVHWSTLHPLNELISGWEHVLPDKFLDPISGPWEKTLTLRTTLLSHVLADELVHRPGWETFRDRAELHGLGLSRASFDAAMAQGRFDEAHAVMDQLKLWTASTSSTTADRIQVALGDMQVDYLFGDGERRRRTGDEFWTKMERAMKRLERSVLSAPSSDSTLSRLSAVAGELALKKTASGDGGGGREAREHALKFMQMRVEALQGSDVQSAADTRSPIRDDTLMTDFTSPIHSKSKSHHRQVGTGDSKQSSGRREDSILTTTSTPVQQSPIPTPNPHHSSTGEDGRVILLGEAHYQLGLFAERALEHTGKDVEGLRRTAVENLLKAIKHGSMHAENAFPAVLALVSPVDSDDPSRIAFDDLAPECVNARALTRWTAQLLSLLDQTDAVDAPLMSLARTFPQALYYPYRVAREALEDRMISSVESGQDKRSSKEKSKSKESVKSKGSILERLDALERAMDLPRVVLDFCEAIEGLTHPELRVRDALKQIASTLTRAERTSAPELRTSLEARARSVFEREIIRKVFGMNPSRAGKYNHAFILNNVDKFKAALKGDLTKDVVNRLAEDMSKACPKPVQGQVPLDEFSSWLDSFAATSDRRGKSMGRKEELEVPGWRDVWHAQMVSEDDRPFHIVRAFDSRMLQLSSMRMPKRLTMRCVDGRRKDFLVKGGEDLRLDERIQQLFSAVNKFLGLNAETNRRGLKLETYRVVPVSLTSGLIEWVPDTKPLKACITEQAAKAYKLNPDIRHWEAFRLQNTFISQQEGADKYRALYSSVKDEESAAQFSAIVEAVPADLLRKHLVAISEGPEAFLAVRQIFCSSLACVSMASYILGIGDRHLENFLINPSGQLIAIDFGYSFGVGVVMLPVPETTPMRLTPQLVHVLAPMDAREGPFFQASLAIMACLRLNRNRLMDILAVFVKEPLLDWINQASLKAMAQSSSSAASPFDENIWRPLVTSRVRVADLKLRGVRPSYVMSAELKERANKKGLEDVIGAVVRAGTRDEASTTDVLKQAKSVALKDSDESEWIIQTQPVQEQVLELIKISTDPALLMRQWQMAFHWL